MNGYPPPGRLVDIGGRRLHLQERGTGSPTVVLEAGIGATSLNWQALQREISRFTRVVSYDRAGLGWSDLPTAPLTMSRLVDDLRTLLRAAQLPPPYILVGHSFGALIVRAYAGRYAGEVAGILLLDPLRPEEWRPLSWNQRATLAYGLRLARRGAMLARIGLVGWCLQSVLAGSRWLPKVIAGAASGSGLKVMKRLAGEVGKMPAEVWPMVAAHWSNPKCFLGLAAHLETFPGNVAEMYCAPPLDGIPVIALTSGRNAGPPPQGVSANMRHSVAHNSGHWIHLDEPNLVMDGVRDLVTNARLTRK
jgi:pimeloyl-ACP methyl ester carboxylesterase